MCSGTLERERSGVVGLHKEDPKRTKHYNNGRTFLPWLAYKLEFLECVPYTDHHTLDIHTHIWATRARGECLAISVCSYKGHIRFGCRDLIKANE
jgi:hypothetical protein